MEKKKLKMANSTLRKILIPFMVLFLIVILLLTTVSSVLGSTLDTYLGAGAKSIVGGNGADADYYTVHYQNGEESTEAAYAVARRVAEEGSTLLKNNGILPLEKGTSVMPFGYAYLNPIYGQLTSGGSARWVIDPVTPEQGLSAFTINNAAADLMRAASVEVLEEAPGTLPAGEAGSLLGGDCKIYEYNSSIYSYLAPVSGTVGIVFITRSGQEGQDQKYDAYSDGTPHYLALSENEKGAIRAAKNTCGQVILVLVSSAPLEMGVVTEGELECDAILWVGHPGERGFITLSDLLDGDVNPSGRTVDTWSADFTADPSYQAIGEHRYTNYTVASGSYTDGGEFNGLYNDYMEGVYMGYRYYETADEVDPSFEYSKAVIYPFGYGLSYTTFDKELLSLTDDGYTIKAEVKVTNTGSRAGKDAAELYFSSPYTELDKTYQIEKPSVNLVAFGKTRLLAPGESQVLELTFTWDDMTSYCYTRENPDGTVGCWMLDAGEYVISLRENSHEVLASYSLTRAEEIWYDGSDDDHIRKSEKNAQSGDASAAANLFQIASDYMNTDSTILSRADWTNTQPEGVSEKAISEEFKALLGIETTFDPETDKLLGNVAGSYVYAETAPTSNAKNGLVLSDLRGADYDDPRWDALLDQIDWDGDKQNIIQNFSGDAYTTAAIDSIGLPSTVDEDGANGLKINGSGEGGYDMTKSSSFGFAPLMAATWNVELLYEVGEAFGQESLTNGVNGWYCPAVNLHRSFFSGRVFEYYSEDPVLSGLLASAVISGAGDQGMFCYIKHFALNETETGRSSLISTWADEQTMRELYFRPFEIAIKNAVSTLKYYDENGVFTEKTFRSATAVMATQTNIAGVPGECSYPLLTSLLREEWGFEGMVISDYWVWNGNNLRDLCVRAGCDTYLCMYMPIMWSISDYDSATSRSAMRQAIRNTAYAVVNSNAMQGYAPGAVQKTAVSPWKAAFLAVSIILGILVAAGIVWLVLRQIDDKKHPENYKHKVRKKAQKKAQQEA